MENDKRQHREDYGLGPRTGTTSDGAVDRSAVVPIFSMWHYFRKE